MKLANGITRLGGRALKRLSEASPTLLVVGGIAAGVGAGVMACKETIKAQPVIEDHKKYTAAIEEAKKAGVTAYGEPYDKKDYAKDLFIQYSKTTKNLLKVYWPSVTLAGVSVAMILAGHHIINKRYVAAVGAYKAVSDTFADYRKRVADKIGPEAEKELRYNVKKEVVKEADPENGVTSEQTEIKFDKEHYINGTERYFHGDKYDADGNLIERASEGYDGSINGALYNARYLELKEQTLNQMLERKGYLTLNEAYDELGFTPTEEGQLIGWRYDKNNSHKIDLGIHDLLDPAVTQFQLGVNPDILLIFNCDEEPLVHFKRSHKERSEKTLSGAQVPTKEVFC